MKNLLNWIVPNRCDGQLLALLILMALAAAVTMSGLEASVYASLMNAFLAALFCFPAVIGTKSWSDIKRSIPLLLVAMLSPLLVLAVGVFWKPEKNSAFYANSVDLGMHRSTAYFIFLCAWLAILVIAVGFSKIADRWLAAGTDIKKTRVRMLLFQMLLWRPKPIDRPAAPKRIWPSSWGLSAIVVSIVLLVASALFDFGVIFNSGGTASLQMSRVVRKLKWQPGVEMTYEGFHQAMKGRSTSEIHLLAKFSADAPADYFADFADRSDSIEVSLDLSNLRPDIDLQPLICSH